MSKIKKSTILITLLHPADLDPREFMTLEQIEYEMNYEGSIGNWSVQNTVDVPDEEVEDELLAIGNDGTFFDFELED